MIRLKCVHYIIYLILAVFLIGAFLYFDYEVVIAPAEAHELNKERDDIDRIMTQLRQCESSGKDTAINYNDGKKGVHSYGRYQWQLKSAIHYNNIYKILPDIEDAEMENVIFDPDFQDQLTRRVLEDGGWRNWKNCLKKYYD